MKRSSLDFRWRPLPACMPAEWKGKLEGYYEYYINGRSLTKLISQATGYDFMQQAVGTVYPGNRPFDLLNRTLFLGVGDPHTYFSSYADHALQRRIPLYVTCSACLDIGCGGLSVQWIEAEQTVTWDWGADATLPPFHFDKNAYHRAVQSVFSWLDV